MRGILFMSNMLESESYRRSLTESKIVYRMIQDGIVRRRLIPDGMDIKVAEVKSFKMAITIG